MTSASTPLDAAAVVELAHREGVELIRFEYCDLSGIARSKAITVQALASKLVEGVSLTRAQTAIDLLEQLVHVEGMEPVGEIRLVPDPATFTVLPWAPGSASVLCDQLDHDRTDWGACPRSYLKRVLDRAADRGLFVQASVENEYYLAREVDGRYVPSDLFDHAPVYSPIGHDLHHDLTLETVRALDAQGMVAEQAINEYGRGQQEISIRHTDALRAADHQMKFRDTVRGVALRHGLLASFAAKPFADSIGSGAHVHFSLWDSGGRSALYDPAAERGLSALGRQFLAGVLEHLPALVALTTPSYNSSRRLAPGAWASSTRSWGFDNKEVALRVVSPFFQREEASYNVEFKVSDPSANPYLALGALVAAGLDGVERGLALPDPCEHDPARMSAADRERCGVVPLPVGMAAGLDALEADTYLLGTMPDLLARAYLAVRRSEEAAFAAQDEEFELRHHFYRF